jgi:chromosome segregation ATPase
VTKGKFPTGSRNFIPGARLAAMRPTGRRAAGKSIQNKIFKINLNKQGGFTVAVKRDAYIEKLKGNIDKWNAEIDEFQAKADKAKDDAQAEFHKQIAEIKAKRQELEGKMADLKNASEEAWEDIKGGVDVSRQILGQAIKSAKDRFN